MTEIQRGSGSSSEMGQGETTPGGKWRYKIHYLGWAARWDDWLDNHRIYKGTEEMAALLKRESGAGSGKYAVVPEREHQSKLKQEQQQLPQLRAVQARKTKASTTTNQTNRTVASVMRGVVNLIVAQEQQRLNVVLIKKPLASYVLFSNAIRPPLKEEFPQLSLVELSREMGKRWKALTTEQRMVWKNAATAETKRFKEQCQQATANGELDRIPLRGAAARDTALLRKSLRDVKSAQKASITATNKISKTVASVLRGVVSSVVTQAKQEDAVASVVRRIVNTVAVRVERAATGWPASASKKRRKKPFQMKAEHFGGATKLAKKAKSDDPPAQVAVVKKQVRVDITGHARTRYVVKSQSCMF